MNRRVYLLSLDTVSEELSTFEIPSTHLILVSHHPKFSQLSTFHQDLEHSHLFLITCPQIGNLGGWMMN